MTEKGERRKGKGKKEVTLSNTQRNKNNNRRGMTTKKKEKKFIYIINNIKYDIKAKVHT